VPKRVSKQLSKTRFVPLVALISMGLSACGGGGGGAGTTAEAATPEAFFEGKTISFIVPYGPGGGYDTYARSVAPALEKCSGASVRVENVEGGGGYTGTSHTLDAKSDGLTIGLINTQGVALGTLLNDPLVDFDLKGITYLGALGVDDTYVEVGPKSDFKSGEDLLKANSKELIWAATGVGSSEFYRAAIFSALFGLEKARMVAAYGSSGEVIVALERGDADGVTYSPASARIGVSALVPVARFAEERGKEYPDVPTIYELGDIAGGFDDDQKALADFLVAVSASPTTVVGPAGIDSERAEFLEAAIACAAKDPQVQKRAAAAKAFINYMSADEVKEIVTQDMLALPAAGLDSFNEYMERFQK
jgi:tripartite-type tricarboxylate transporter receptor subunit TctC